MHWYRDVNGAYIVRSFSSENYAQRLTIALSVMFVSSCITVNVKWSLKLLRLNYI